MKKQYFAGVLCLAAAFTLLLSACGTADPGAQSPAAPDDPATDGSAAESPASQPDGEDPESVFTPGTWLSDSGQYYFFDAGTSAGRTASLEDGTGVGFTYTVNGSEAAFSMGGADTSTSCTVSRDGNVITLSWADGTAEQLTYVSDQGSDTFQFYSDQELADLALAYYKESSGAEDNPNLASAAQANEDGSVSIQVYENLGDHNSTAAWYTVDRTTAVGTDSAGSPVDLSD